MKKWLLAVHLMKLYVFGIVFKLIKIRNVFMKKVNDLLFMHVVYGKVILWSSFVISDYVLLIFSPCLCQFFSV
ncbi:unnamed protein product [Schistosoma curassoni]|uniref:Uncharacterized protein n=1 Tax=Schistosoma curassoni TaxID=6186 RepID=A0A183KZG4_9TREM|nr:unnamed protein product [Schistosoma curassoni]